VAFYKLGDPDKAIDFFEKAIKKNPSNKRASFYKFKVLVENGEAKKASRFLRKIHRPKK
jgi:tetratricopeptide (TPR) repeat protein